MGFDRNIEGDEAHATLLDQLQSLVRRWREEADDYTGVMYYNDGDKERDDGRRAQKDADADELQGIIDGHIYN